MHHVEWKPNRSPVKIQLVLCGRPFNVIHTAFTRNRQV